MKRPDPRGPHRKVVKVHPLAHSNGGDLIGDYYPVELDCGHTNKMAPHFFYKVGSELRCWHCGQEGQS